MLIGNGTDDERELAAYAEATTRGRRNEPWLTKAIGFILSADDVAAGSFARTIVHALDPLCVPPPARLRSAPEEPFIAGLAGQRKRSADLFLWSAEGNYALLVEAKLGAACSTKQIPDYLRLRPSGLRGLTRNAKVDVAVLATRSLALPATRERARWLGCATWLEIVDELERLEFRDTDRAHRWRSLLKRYRHASGFGTPRDTYLPPENALDSSVIRIVAAAREASNGALRVAALPWSVAGQRVVRKRRTGASMCIELKAPRRRATCVDIHLHHPAGAKPSVEIVRWRGQRKHAFPAVAVAKNAARCREQIAESVSRLVLDGQLP